MIDPKEPPVPPNPFDEEEIIEESCAAAAPIPVDLPPVPANLPLLEEEFPVDAVESPSDTIPVPQAKPVSVPPVTSATRRGPFAPSPFPTPPAKQAPPTPRIDLKLQLPNGSVGKPYEYITKLEVQPTAAMPSSEGVTIHCERIQGLGDLGLMAIVKDGHLRLTGTPTKAGDHAVTLHFLARTRTQEPTPAFKKLTLTINPDPRSLWKELEPEQEQTFRKPHTDRQRLTGSMVLLGASRRGRSHAHEAKFREDDFRIHALDDGWSFMAVADGAGSSKLSRRGSQLACITASDIVRATLPKACGDSFDPCVNDYVQNPTAASKAQIGNALYNVLGGAGHSAYRAIDAEAKAHGGAIKDLATTLNLTLCKRFACGWFVAAFAVGDGGVGIYRKGTVEILNKPDSGEFAGQTRFLTMSEIWNSGAEINNRILFQVVPDLTAVIAMTDGVSDPKFATDKNFFDPAKWDALWTDLGPSIVNRNNDQADAELLEWLNFWSPGNHDDRTIALMLP